MKQRFTVTLDDPVVEFDVTSDGRDMRAWESWKEVAYFEARGSLTKFAELAYLAAKRTGEYDGTWEEFEARCTGALPVKDNENPTEGEAPTPPAATADSSSTSPSKSASHQAPSSKRARTS